jgi:hypothetical protein
MSFSALTAVRHYPGIELGPHDAKRLRRWLAWEETPIFPEPGRSAWLPLSEPIAHPTVPGLSLTAAKVKGIGLSRCEGGKPRPPDGDRRYLPGSVQPHFGIGPEGNYVEAFSQPAPLGGMVVSRALREHENTERLLASQVPAFVPFAVFSAHERFESESLGVVVTLSTEPAPYRATSLIATRDAIGSRAEHVYRLAAERSLGLDVSLFSQEGLAAGFAALSAATGRSLRGLADAGLYRHSSSLANLVYCTSRKRLLLTDLDSTRALVDVDFERRGLELLRDVASAVHKLVESIFMRPQLLRDAGLVRIVEQDPIWSLLRAYFADVPARSVRRAVSLIWAYTIPLVISVDRRRRAAGAEWSRDRREMYRDDKWTLYALTMMACRPLLAASGLGKVGLPSPAQVGVSRALPLVGDGAVFLRWAEIQIRSTERRRPAPR